MEATKADACGHCGGEIPGPGSLGAPKLYCGPKCKKSAAEQRRMKGSCPGCGVTIRYDSDRCRSCRSRGTWAKARAQAETQSETCGHCGVVFDRPSGPGRPRKFCSPRCRVAAADGYERTGGVCLGCNAAIRRGAERCKGCQTRKMLAEMAARLAGQKWKCAQCAAEYEPTHDRQKYCSDRCQNRYRHINRTKPGQYRGELIALCDVYRRDEGKCQLCGDPVDLSIRWPDPLSASLDHVVPQSKGGPHTFSNVQLAHLSCNSRKHNRTE